MKTFKAMDRKILESGISIIIPTTCEKKREKNLFHAINSIKTTESIPVEIIVVANGGKIDQSIMDKLKSDKSLRVIYDQTASQQNAQLVGRKNISYSYFGFLDDDDELLPGALEERFKMLSEDPGIAAAVSNGTRQSSEGVFRYFVFEEVMSDVVATLLRKNWLASCGALYRASMVDAGYFIEPFYEFTYIAFRLALKYRIGFIDQDGFIVHADTPDSLSKTEEYNDAYISFLYKLLDIPSSPKIQKLIKMKLCIAYHCMAIELMKKKQYVSAWRSHFHSLMLPGGFKFIPFTRRMVFGNYG